MQTGNNNISTGARTANGNGNDICNKVYCRSTAEVWGEVEEYKNTFLPCKSQNTFSGSLNLSLNLY